MTGLILIVDDVPANVKLLEAKLSNEYFDVITASDGYGAIDLAAEHKPDLILLDVMMPGIDGFETCRKLKESAEVAHIPVVMVTALSEPSDRISGLEAGADDFITKPINDTALFARVRSLVRIKVLIDELRLRDQSGSQMGLDNMPQPLNMDVSGSKILIVDDDVVQSKRMKERLSAAYEVDVCSDHTQSVPMAKEKEYDLVIISTQLADIDALRLATQMRAIEYIRNVPIVMMVDEDDQELMLKGLELGINDYLIIPVENNEMFARIKTQIRRKKYQDALKSNYQESMSMAITDGLTRLYNRHYLDTHLSNLVQQSLENNKPMSLMIMDMDHFKHVNDTYGHDVGDEVLIKLAEIIMSTVRSSDLAARYGGEEFVVLMPETDMRHGIDAAERLRANIERYIFDVNHEIGTLQKTVSIGISYLMQDDTPEALMKRADTNLYTAKHSGRNRVVPSVADFQAGNYMPTSQIPKASSQPKQAIEPAPPMPEKKVPHLGGALNTGSNRIMPMHEKPVTNTDPKPPVLPSAPVLSTASSAVNHIDAEEAKRNAKVDLELSRPIDKPKKKVKKVDDDFHIDDEPPGTF